MRVKTNIKVETTVISSGTLDADFSLLISVHNSQILINAPPGTQRFINAYNKKCGSIQQIILNSKAPNALEGLLGLMMTIFSGTKNTIQNQEIISVESDLVKSINSCSADQIFNGQLHFIQETLTFQHQYYSEIFIPFFDSFITIIKFNIELEKLDKNKISALNLNKNQLKQLHTTGKTTTPTTTIYRDDVLQEKLGIGTIIVIPKKNSVSSGTIISLIEPYLDTEYTNYIYTPLPLNLKNSKEYLTHTNVQPKYYPVADFACYYSFLTGLQLADLSISDELQGQFSVLFPHFSAVSLVDFQANSEKVKELTREKQFEFIRMQENEPELTNSLVTLGTGASVPNKYNNVTSVLVNRKYLVDAGEGALQQMIFYCRIAKIDLGELFPADFAIVVTHEHADHFLGICSIISCFYDKHGVYPQICANPIVFKYIEMLMSIQLENFVTHPQITRIPVVHSEYSNSVLIENGEHHLYISGDCIPQKISQYSNLTVLHEATFQDFQLNEAEARNHSTISGALAVIKESGGKAILTHFSQRYARDKLESDSALKAVDLFTFYW